MKDNLISHRYYAPLKKICIVDRHMNDWINADIQALKVIRRNKEDIWRKNPILINFQIYQESCLAVKNVINESKTKVIQKKIVDSKGDQKQLFKSVETLLGRTKQIVLPEYQDPASLESRFNMFFFMDNIDKIRLEFPLHESNLSSYSFESMDSILPTCATVFDEFALVSKEKLIKIIYVMNKTTCLSDPSPVKLLMNHLSAVIDIILHIVNLSISTCIFLSFSIIIPLIKKTGLDSEVYVLKNYRPVSNLSFLSKIIEKVISTQLVTYIVDYGLTDDFQSAYKCGHSTETALLRVYNDIVVTIGKGNGNFLVLLDLSSALDTIDQSNLFTALEKHVGICDDALNLIVYYLSDRKQQVGIDDIMSDLASIKIMWRPAGFCIGPTKVLPLSFTTLFNFNKHDNIGYHIYADDTQLYISFKCNDPLATLPKLNSCISHIRVWMIKNKLKINDSKTEFTVFRSP